jgi:predicted porin
MDVGLINQSFGNGSSVQNVSTGGNGASRLRFVGVEDMGAGTKANFWLEMQPSFQDGTINGAGLFNRGAWAGLSNTRFGEIRLGRMGTNTVSAVCDIDQLGCYTSAYGGGILFSGQGAPGAQGSALFAANPTRGGIAQTVNGTTPFATATTKAATTTTAAVQTVVDSGAAFTNVQASSTGAVAQAGTSWSADSTRYVRAVRYSLPTLVPGLSVNATMAFGQNLTTGGHTGNSSGFDANYVSGPLKITAAYQKADAESAAGATGALTTFGATYNLGFASIGAGMQTEDATAGSGNVAGTITALSFKKAEAFAVTALFPMGAMTPYIKYGERKYSGGAANLFKADGTASANPYFNATTAKVTNVGIRYAFSKRTYVYADYMHNGAAMLSTTTQGSIKNQTNIGLTTNF